MPQYAYPIDTLRPRPPTLPYTPRSLTLRRPAYLPYTSSVTGAYPGCLPYTSQSPRPGAEQSPAPLPAYLPYALRPPQLTYPTHYPTRARTHNTPTPGGPPRHTPRLTQATYPTPTPAHRPPTPATYPTAPPPRQSRQRHARPAPPTLYPGTADQRRATTVPLIPRKARPASLPAGSRWEI